MVSVIILSYNTKDLLDDCLSFATKVFHNIPHEIIVVDNASSDDSLEMVKKKYPTVIRIANKENFGFAKGANIGAQKAQGDYLLFLNSDTYAQNSDFSKIIDYMQLHKDVGVVGVKIKSKSNTLEKSYGRFWNIYSVFMMLTFGKETITKQDKAPLNVDWVNGACMFVRANIFKKLKGFDEYFFMYVEDMEFCYRVRKVGYTIIYNPEVTVEHLGQGSSNREFAIVNIYKGVLYFFKKHKNTVEYIIVRALLVIKAVVLIAIGLLINNHSWRKTYLKALSVAV